jgi:hypothetical protein
LPGLIRQMSTENQLWGRRASTANCSSSGVIGGRRSRWAPSETPALPLKLSGWPTPP